LIVLNLYKWKICDTISLPIFHYFDFDLIVYENHYNSPFKWRLKNRDRRIKWSLIKIGDRIQKRLLWYQTKINSETKIVKRSLFDTHKTFGLQNLRPTKCIGLIFWYQNPNWFCLEIEKILCLRFRDQIPSTASIGDQNNFRSPIFQPKLVNRFQLETKNSGL